MIRPLPLALFAFFVLPAAAQFSAAVQGSVLDPSQSSIPNAKVTLLNASNGISVEEKTNSTGFYRFSSLAPGKYEIKTVAAGFRSPIISIVLTTGQTRDLTINLEVQTAGETVSVTGEAPTLDTSESRQQLTMEQKVLRDIPLLNNSLFSILSLAPGVTGVNGASDNFNPEYFSSMSANGASTRGNTYNVDGLSVTSNITNGTSNFGMNPEAVAEVTVETNTFKAEQGMGSSIIVSMTTKSGTNLFHGAGNYWFTNQDMRARTSLPFIPRYLPFKRHNVSGAFGGPIVKNRTFFFGAVELLRQNDATASVETYESPDFVNWAKARFPATLGVKLLTEYPVSAVSLTNANFRNAQQVLGADCGTANAANIPCDLPMIAQGTWSRAPRRNGLQYNFRGDQYFRDGQDRISGSFVRTQSDNDNFVNRPALNNRSNRFVNGFQANYTHTFRPTMVNELGVSGNRVQGFNGFDSNLKIPAISIAGSTGIGVRWRAICPEQLELAGCGR